LVLRIGNEREFYGFQEENRTELGEILNNIQKVIIDYNYE
jgi:hypothetical protein